RRLSGAASRERLHHPASPTSISPPRARAATRWHRRLRLRRRPVSGFDSTSVRQTRSRCSFSKGATTRSRLQAAMGSARRAVLGVWILGGLVAVSGGVGAGVTAKIAVPAPYAIRHWTAATDNLVAAHGTVTLAGAQVRGAHIRIDGFDVPAATDAKGG